MSWNLDLLAVQLPVGCQTAVHDTGNLEVYRDLANGDRFSQQYDTTWDEVDVAEDVFERLYHQLMGDAAWELAVADGSQPTFTAGAVIPV